jgi:hypothetical protein
MRACSTAAVLSIALLTCGAVAHSSEGGHDCVFDQIRDKLHTENGVRRRELGTESSQEYGNVADHHGRLLQGTTFSPIRIVVDTSNLEAGA